MKPSLGIGKPEIIVSAPRISRGECEEKLVKDTTESTNLFSHISRMRKRGGDIPVLHEDSTNKSPV